MHSVSDDLTPQELWLQERRAEALTRFDERTPALYRHQIDLPPLAAAWAVGTGPASLFLTGVIGVGKTHTAWQAARRWLASRYTGAHRGSPTIQTWRSSRLFDELRPQGDGSSPRSLIRTLQETDLLYVDDLAAARTTEWTQERLFEIFDERYINQRPVLITCDVLPDQLSPVVGERVASRLAEMCRGGMVLMRGADRRQGGAR